jgi:hypothetical protein
VASGFVVHGAARLSGFTGCIQHGELEPSSLACERTKFNCRMNLSETECVWYMDTMLVPCRPLRPALRRGCADPLPGRDRRLHGSQKADKQTFAKSRLTSALRIGE